MLIDLASPQFPQMLDHGGLLESLDWDRNGRLISAGTTGLRVWAMNIRNPLTNISLESLSKPSGALAASPDALTVAIEDLDPPRVLHYSRAGGRPIRVLQFDAVLPIGADQIAFSGDAKYLTLGRHHELLAWDLSSTSASPRHRLTSAGARWFTSFGFAGDGRSVRQETTTRFQRYGTCQTVSSGKPITHVVEPRY